MEIRYFILTELIQPNTALPITPEHDVLPLSSLKLFFRIGGFTYSGQEYHIYRANIPDDLVAELWDHCEGDPLTLEAVHFLGIDGLYGGKDLTELCAIVLEKYGVDLSGTREVEVDGVVMEVPKLVPCKALGE